MSRKAMIHRIHSERDGRPALTLMIIYVNTALSRTTFPIFKANRLILYYSCNSRSRLEMDANEIQGKCSECGKKYQWRLTILSPRLLAIFYPPTMARHLWLLIRIKNFFSTHFLEGSSCHLNLPFAIRIERLIFVAFEEPIKRHKASLGRKKQIKSVKLIRNMNSTSTRIAGFDMWFSRNSRFRL